MKPEDIWLMDSKTYTVEDPWEDPWDPYDEEHQVLRRGALVRLHDWTVCPGATGVILNQEFCPGFNASGPEHLMYTVLVDGKTHTLIYDDLVEIK